MIEAFVRKKEFSGFSLKYKYLFVTFIFCDIKFNNLCVLNAAWTKQAI